MLNFPATCGVFLRDKHCVLPHRDRKWQSNLLSHLVTIPASG